MGIGILILTSVGLKGFAIEIGIFVFCIRNVGTVVLSYLTTLTPKDGTNQTFVKRWVKRLITNHTCHVKILTL